MWGLIAEEKLTFDSGSLELARRHVVSEKQIDFTKGSVLSLWEPEPAPNIAEQISAGVEEASFGAPVPSWKEVLVSVCCDRRRGKSGRKLRNLQVA